MEGEFVLAEFFCDSRLVMVGGEEVSVGEGIDAGVEAVCEGGAGAGGDVVLVEGGDEGAGVGACLVDEGVDGHFGDL